MSTTAEEVISFLRANPAFFSDNSSLLADLYIPHPYSGNTISLAERQQLAMREKNKGLEGRLRQMVQFGEENDVISEKIHRLTVALFAAPDLNTRLAAVYRHLESDFALADVAIRLFAPEPDAAGRAEFLPVSDMVRGWMQLNTLPGCGSETVQEALGWFGRGDALQSFASIALVHDGKLLGLMVLGSTDAMRFYPEMGTIYLKRLGELISAALVPLLATSGSAAAA